MTEMRKFYAEVQLDPNLGERQIRVIANSGKSDRAKDVLVAKGCKLDNYLNNNIVLADHDRKEPIGNFAPEIIGESVAGILTFAPKDISAKADQYCGLYKAGVMKSVSVGFNPIEYDVNKNGGYDFKQWELLELSCVAVPCDPGAVVTARTLATADKREFLLSDGDVKIINAALASSKADGSWKVGASLNLPMGADDEWDEVAAVESIFVHCGFYTDKPDMSLARKAFLTYDASRPKDGSAYKFPFAKVIDGRLIAVPAGIRAAHADLLKSDISTDCETKAHAVIDHYEAKMQPNEDDKAARIAELENLLASIDGKALSAADMDHVKCLQKCMASMGDCHVKALDSHGQTHEQLTQFAQHLAAAGEHMKALKSAGRKKPKPANSNDGPAQDDPEADPGDDPEDNIELAAEAERRKRLIEIARLAA